MTRIFHRLFFMKMNSMSGCDIRLVFTFPPNDSTLLTLQYKKCVHLCNNFPCISTLTLAVLSLFTVLCSTLLCKQQFQNLQHYSRRLPAHGHKLRLKLFFCLKVKPLNSDSHKRTNKQSYRDYNSIYYIQMLYLSNFRQQYLNLLTQFFYIKFQTY